MIRLEPKLPGEVRDYRHVWTPFLGDDDTIASQVTTTEGVTLDSLAVEAGDKSVKFWVSGGTGGTTGKIVHTITSVGGRTETEIFTIAVLSAEEPVSLTEAKNHLRILDDDSEDALISGYIRTARAFAERYTGHVFVRRQLVEQFSSFSRFLELSRRPIINVDGVDYTDAEGVTAEFEDFWPIIGNYPVRVYPATSWPSLHRHGVVSVRYTAGYEEGEQAEELEIARQAILLLVGHWFENRSTVVVGTIASQVPFAVNSLLDSISAAPVW